MRIYTEKSANGKREYKELEARTLKEAKSLVKQLRDECDYFNIVNSSEMSNEQFLAALETMKARIESGLIFEAWDDETIGEKELHCSYGLCSKDEAQWNDVSYHTFPTAYEQDKRVSVIGLQDHQYCPFDSRDLAQFGRLQGCFWRCRIFQQGYAPAPKETIELYEEAINEAKRF